MRINTSRFGRIDIDAADIIHPQGGCPWVTSGLTAECERVADAYQVPILDVLGAANSACGEFSG